jgi:hypothetical protein
MAKQKSSGWLDKYTTAVSDATAQPNPGPVFLGNPYTKEMAKRQTYLSPQRKSAAPAMKQAALDRAQSEKTSDLNKKIATYAQNIGGALELAAPFTGLAMPILGAVGTGLDVGGSAYLASKDVSEGNYGSAITNAGFGALGAAGFAPMVKYNRGLNAAVNTVDDVSDISGLYNSYDNLGREYAGKMQNAKNQISSNSGGSDLVSVVNNATNKFLDTFVDPIKYKKQIQEVKAAHTDLPNYMSSPDVVRRLQNLGINDPSKLAYPDLTFSRGGSYFNNLDNKINIDLTEPTRYADTRQFTHRGTYDHEVGHWLQKESYVKGGGYQKDLSDFNNQFKKWKSDKEAWKQKHPSPYTIDAITEDPGLPSIFPPLRVARPTVVDDELIKRLNPNITSDISKENYDYFKNDGLEAYPFMRETKREMIQQGYIPNETNQIEPSVVANFLKDNPKNRISSFVDPNFLNGLHLSKLMNKFPALAPVVGAGAVATATQEYNDGGPIQPNYNDASVSMSEDFVGDGYNTKGRNYSPAWGGQFEDGGFLQPNSYKLPKGIKVPYADPSSELSMSIGGEGGEPAYLIPSFKYGQPLKNPMAEYMLTGEHLGGPFKTWQDADEFGKLRHQYVEKGQAIPSPIATSNMAMGGSLPGATGMMYARYSSGGAAPGDADYNAPRNINPSPSKGPYGKKTPASAQNGAEMKFYQNGLDFKPKSISKNGSKIIKDDRGQWAHPGEITDIGSNQITMQGVPYPVIGISDTGDIQMMYPNQEYQYDGSSVTEYPMMKEGGALQLVKLDQLTNFTNYNTKQPGQNWLDKYQ